MYWLLLAYVNTFLYLCSKKKDNSLTPKSRKGIKIMTNVLKEQVIDSVEAYAKAVEKEAYDKVLTILWTNFNQLDKIVNSDESMNILMMSTGDKFDSLYDKRISLRKKLQQVHKIINKVAELRYGTIKLL